VSNKVELRIFFVEFVPLRKGKKFVLNDMNKVPCLHLLNDMNFLLCLITSEVSKVEKGVLDPTFITRARSELLLVSP
jgi:hypothetical protein